MLAVRSLTKSHARTPILTNFSLTLQPHEILFLTGPSGCGKSTALRAIANLDIYDSGQISLNGLTPQTVGSAQWRRDVMYVSQTRIQQDCTPVELFVRALRFESRKGLVSNINEMVVKYVALCEEVGLEKMMVKDQKWMELSGGQAQRALVAMSIALKPKVLLLDEPSSSCDHESALMVERVIVNSGIAAIWVTHDVAQPHRVGGRIMRLGQGTTQV